MARGPSTAPAPVGKGCDLTGREQGDREERDPGPAPRTPWPPWHMGQVDCLVTLTHLQAWFLSDEMSRASVSC